LETNREETGKSSCPLPSIEIHCNQGDDPRQAKFNISSELNGMSYWKYQSFL